MSTNNRSPLEQCALASGLLTPEQLDSARASVRSADGGAADVPGDRQLADRLVQMCLINGWQAKQLLEGRTKFNLGPYRIVDSIGQGGMGQVFKAEHNVLGRIVAVKVLPRDKSTPEAIANFTREIQALAKLDHPRLVRAIDAGHDGNVYYLVTEYVPGCDLRKLIRRNGPLGMEAAASIISQVAEGLEHAHERGLIHRDVKPGNVLVTPEGEAKLSDLGLAGPMDADLDSDPRYGKIVGTADYLSPDHIDSPWDPKPAWDVYSLGCTLYYAVTGKVPFPGGTTADKARAHRELRPLHPRLLNASLNPPFIDLIADMMAKDPAQRLQSAAQVVERLLPWTSQSPWAAKGLTTATGPLPSALPDSADAPSPDQIPGAASAVLPPVAPPPVIAPRVSAPPPWPAPLDLPDTVLDIPSLVESGSNSEDSMNLIVTSAPLAGLLRPPLVFVTAPAAAVVVVGFLIGGSLIVRWLAGM